MKANARPAFFWRQCLGYGAADFACNLIWQVISLYLLYFYVDVVKINPAAIAFMFVVTRVFDGCTDLLMGYIIDRTHTRFGKSRPYFLIGAIPFALCGYLAFSVPDLSETGKLVYAYITYMLLSFAYTVVNIPLASILPALSPDANTRTAYSTSRKFFGFLGATVVSAFALGAVSFLGQGNEAAGFSRTMIVCGVISCLIFLVTFLSVHERPLPVQKNPSLGACLKSLAHNGPWKIFALNILFMWGGFFIQTAAIVYYFAVVVGSRELAVTVATIMSVIPMLANFAVPFLAARLGKRNLYVISALIQLAGLCIIWAGGTMHPVILAGAVISAAGYGMKESIYFSMQADPVDYGIWKTGVDTAGTLSAVNGFLGKVAQAIAGGICGLLLSWGNYDAQSAIQSAEAITAIKAMYLYIPMILLVLSTVTMLTYNLDKLCPTIKADLNARLQANKQQGSADQKQ